MRRKDGEFATGVLHLWHPEASRALLPDNERLLEQALAGDRVQAQAGMARLQVPRNAVTTVGVGMA